MNITPVGTVRLRWFHFSQNNSGGYFIEDEQVAEDVYIQDVDADSAICRAGNIFAGRDDFCPCCGERWSYYIRDEDGTDEPMYYGEPIRTSDAGVFSGKARLHYFDGTVKPYVMGSGEPI